MTEIKTGFVSNDYLEVAAKKFARHKARALFERPEIKNAAIKLNAGAGDLFELELAITGWLAECSMEFFRTFGAEAEQRMIRAVQLLDEAMNTRISPPLIIEKNSPKQEES